MLIPVDIRPRDRHRRRFDARRVVLIFGMGLTLLASASCTSARGGASPGTAEEFRALTKLSPPPPSVPALWLGEERIPVGAYDWIIDGEHRVFHAAETPAEVNLPEIAMTGDSLRFVLDSDVQPAQLYVSLFRDISANGEPSDPTGDEINCLDSTRCIITFKGGQSHFEVDGTRGTRIAVVHLGYLADSGEIIPDCRVCLLTAAWGVRFPEG